MYPGPLVRARSLYQPWWIWFCTHLESSSLSVVFWFLPNEIYLWIIAKLVCFGGKWGSKFYYSVRLLTSLLTSMCSRSNPFPTHWPALSFHMPHQGIHGSAWFGSRLSFQSREMLFSFHFSLNFSSKTHHILQEASVHAVFLFYVCEILFPQLEELLILQMSASIVLFQKGFLDHFF